MSHVTHTNEPCRVYTWVTSWIQMSHIKHTNGSNCTYKRVPILEQTGDSAQTREHVKESHRIYKWGMMHIQTSHELEVDSSDSAHSCTHMAESYCIYNWGMLHIQICRVPDTNESYRRYKWVTSHVQTSHEPGADSSYSAHTRKNMQDSYRIFKWLMSQIQMSNIMHTNESRTWSRLERFGGTAHYHCYRRSWEISHIPYAIELFRTFEGIM